MPAETYITMQGNAWDAIAYRLWGEERFFMVLVKFDHPVQLADRVLSEVIMRRPTMGDLLDYPVDQTTGLKEEVALMAHICGICVEDIRGMDSQDYNRLQEQLLRFRGVSV